MEINGNQNELAFGAIVSCGRVYMPTANYAVLLLVVASSPRRYETESLD